jgi:hypothetical protein
VSSLSDPLAHNPHHPSEGRLFQTSNLPGYHRIESALLDGDGLAQPVTWRDRSSLGGLQGQVIRLKFYVRDARLYSFRIA